MGTISDKLTYLNTTKSQLKQMISYGYPLSTETFRQYVGGVFKALINSMSNTLNPTWNNLPKITTTAGTSQSINNTIEAPMRITLSPSELVQKNVPNEYTQVEYIQNSDAQYINTNFYPNYDNGFKFEIDYTPTNLSNRGCLLSNYNATKHVSFEIGYGGFATNQRIYINNGAPDFAVAGITLGKNKGIMSYYNGVVTNTINGTSETRNTTISGSSNLALNMFTDNAQRFSTFVNYLKIYRCKIYDGTTLVRDFIPCYRNSDGEIGMYDLVNDVFYTNAGTGTFIKGNDILSVPTPDRPLDINTINKNNTLKELGKNLVDVSTQDIFYTLISGKHQQTYGNGVLIDYDYDIDYIYHNQYRFVYMRCNLEKGKTYHIDYDTTNLGTTTPTINQLLRLKDGSTQYTAKTFIPDDDANIICVYLGGLPEGTKIAITNIQVELGNSKTSYMPFEETNHPIDLNEIEYCKISTYEDKFIRTTGRNISYVENNSGNGITFDGNDINIVNPTSYWYGNAGWNLRNNTKYSGKTYTIYAIANGTTSGTSISFNIAKTGNSYAYQLSFPANQTTYTNYTKVQAVELANDEVFTGISIYTASSSTANLNIKVMIVEGNYTSSTIGEYEPYGTGDWYYKQAVGKYQLDGTKNWYIQSTNDYQCTLATDNRIYLAKSGTGISNYFPVASSGTGIYLFPILQSGTDYIRIVSATSQWATTDDFKTFLTNNEVYLYYPLATPTYTKITGTLAEQLEAIYNAMSKDGMTNISQVNNDLPFVISASALQDLS